MKQIIDCGYYGPLIKIINFLDIDICDLYSLYFVCKDLMNIIKKYILNYYSNVKLSICCYYGYTEFVKLLLKDSRVDPSANDSHAIRWSIRDSNIEIIKLLLEDGRADPSDNNNYAIRYAIEYGHIEIVKILLNDSRVDTSNCDYEIKNAIENGHKEIVKLLKKEIIII